jgi:uncharacterized protein (TIGR03085 family)
VPATDAILPRIATVAMWVVLRTERFPFARRADTAPAARIAAVTRFARQERQALADELTAVGPDAPTLCTGWTARDLAAHVVLRERNPLASAGIVVKQLSGLNRRRLQRLASREYPKLVEMLRHPPAWSAVSNPLLDEATNLVEMYIHHEDVRRAQPGWQARTLSPELQAALWERVKRTAKLSLRRFRAPVVVQSPDHGRITAGMDGGAADRPGGAEVLVQGAPSELLLFLTGRQDHAVVEVSGPPDTAARLRRARLGL